MTGRLSSMWFMICVSNYIVSWLHTWMANISTATLLSAMNPFCNIAMLRQHCSIAMDKFTVNYKTAMWIKYCSNIWVEYLFLAMFYHCLFYVICITIYPKSYHNKSLCKKIYSFNEVIKCVSDIMRDPCFVCKFRF